MRRLAEHPLAVEASLPRAFVKIAVLRCSERYRYGSVTVPIRYVYLFVYFFLSFFLFFSFLDDPGFRSSWFVHPIMFLTLGILVYVFLLLRVILLEIAVLVAPCGVFFLGPVE